MSDTILEMVEITKNFPGVKALERVSLKVKNDEIHAIVGENGAGKSTLMKILSGVYAHDSFTGSILFQNKQCHFNTIRDSENKGIVIIHQELALIPTLSIAENIFLGNEQAKFSIIDWHKTSDNAMRLLNRVGLNENPNTLVSNIGVGKQQLVEIAKALSKKVKLLILDEPTAALNDEESNNLLELLLDLKKNGVTSILISHKLNEIAKVADTITVIRDGQVIETMENSKHEIDQNKIIKSMVGREIGSRFPERKSNIGNIVFELKNWTVDHPSIDNKHVLKDINLNIKKGEVVGLAGLMGAGRTELAMSLFGHAYGRYKSGTISINGKNIDLHDIPTAIKNGLAYATEDRKEYGLILINDIKRNISLASLKKVAFSSVINEHSEFIKTNEYKEKMNIKCSSLRQIVGNLSGGNQQKVVLSKWIFSNPDILILDEPTRGIDVGAKYEIYTIINQLVQEGKSILLISSEMPELLGMCDRIYVLTDGELSGELDKSEATQERIMKCIMDHHAHARKH